MASPQEVIEQAMYHPADSTPESRRSGSTRVLRALAANEYGFMRKRRPVTEQEDGECQTCKREMVHVDHGEVYMDSLQRMAMMVDRMRRLEEALHRIAAGQCSDPVEEAKKAVY